MLAQATTTPAIPEITGGSLCFLIGVVLVALFIAAAILRSACSLARVEEIPGYGHAVVILLIVGAAQFLINLAVGMFVAPAMPETDQTTLALAVTSFVVNAVVTVLLYKVSIPTDSFGRACAVWFIQLLIGLVIVAVLAGVVLAIAMAAGMKLTPQ